MAGYIDVHSNFNMNAQSVPGPVTGAGLPGLLLAGAGLLGLLLAGAGLLGWWRRHLRRFARSEAVRCRLDIANRSAASASEERIAMRLLRSILTREVRRASRSRIVLRTLVRDRWIIH